MCSLFLLEPTPPRNLTGGNTGIMSAVLQWLEPLDPNGIILYYVVYYSEGMTFQMSSASSQEFPPDTTTQQISSLSSDTYYTFVVAANNSLRMSNFSNELTIFIPGKYKHTCLHTYNIMSIILHICTCSIYVYTPCTTH